MLASFRRSVALWICPELVQSGIKTREVPTGVILVKPGNPAAKEFGARIAALDHGVLHARQVKMDRLVSRFVSGDENGRGFDPDLNQKAEAVDHPILEGLTVGHGSLLGGVSAPEAKEPVLFSERFLLDLAEAYSVQKGLTLTTVGTYAVKDGKFFNSLVDGKSCTLRRAKLVVDWFDAKWPADLEWPRQIPRPPKAKKEAA